MFDEKAQLLRIYLAERDVFEGIPLHEWIMRKASELGVAGATAIKGIAGFCSHSPVKTPAMLSLTVNQPIIIEIVEQPEAIDRFCKAIEEVIPQGLMTVEDVSIRFFGHPHNKRKQ